MTDPSLTATGGTDGLGADGEEHAAISSSTHKDKRFMGQVSTNTSWSGRRRAFPSSMRQTILRRDPTCQCSGCPHCGGHCAARSTIADHKISHAECLRRDIEPDTIDNGQGLCVPCHDHKTKTERQAGIRRLRPRRTPRHPSDGVG